MQEVVSGENTVKLNTLYNEECIEGMRRIADKSIDMILCDLPYGTTACKWDTIIPFDELWPQYERVIKDNGAIVLTASQPFTSALVMSNPKIFKYQWTWVKNEVTGFANAKKQPLRNVEEVLVFYKKLPNYNPQGLIEVNKKRNNENKVGGNSLRGDVEKSKNKGLLRTQGHERVQKYTNYPRQAIEFKREKHTVHPTQKPVALLEYLIRTYTNEGETVLDNCIGSGSTAVAAINTNRNFIGFELDADYCVIANKRIYGALETKEDE